MHARSRTAAAVAVLLGLRAIALFSPIFGQSATRSPGSETALAFDAATVKVHDAGPGGINLNQAGGHLSIRGFSLQQLMGVAYGLPNLSQAANIIKGMPNWGVIERFNVEAEAPGTPTVGQKRLMLQSLLADRFKLVVHHETRQLPLYALVLAHDGKLGPQIRLHSSTEHCDASASAAYEPWGPQHALVGGVGLSTQDSPAQIALAALQRYPCGPIVGGLLTAKDRNQVWSGGRNVSMDTIAAGIGTMEDIDRTVVNVTGLGGDFDFTVEWDARANHAATNPSPAAPSEPLGNSLFEALREQVGLELKAQKGPVDVIVIDHVDQPQRE